jgi:hypothetical protein
LVTNVKQNKQEETQMTTETKIIRTEKKYSINFHSEKANNSSFPLVSIDKEDKTLRWTGLDNQSLEDLEIFQKALEMAKDELKNLI